MATYKVIQDIEAEDKLVGPLTLRQFIYAGVSAVCFYVCFLFYTKGASFFIVLFLPIGVVSGFFAFPWKGEQPTEIWALARLRFMIKPRVRTWNQSGVKDVVSITAPRRLEARRPLTNNLSENEVRSRLKALADTIDSRGWATRNAAYGIYGQQQSLIVAPGQLPVANVANANDMFDDRGTAAQNFDAMLQRSSQNQRQRVVQQMTQAQTPPPPMPQTQVRPVARPQAQPSYQAPPQPQNYAPPMPTNQPAPSLPAPIMPAPAPQPQYAPQAQQYAQPQPFQQQPMQQPMAMAPMPAAAPPMPASASEQDFNAILQAAKAHKPVEPANSVPANDFWFAGDTTNPTAGGSLPPVQAPPANTGPALAATLTPAASETAALAPVAAQPPAPAPPQPTAPAAAPNANPAPLQSTEEIAGMPVVPAAPATSTASASALSDSYAAAIASGKIMTDVPIAAAVNPTSEELAFAEQLKQNRKAQQGGDNHLRSLQPLDANGQPIPGFDPSQAQSLPQPQAPAPAAQNYPPQQPAQAPSVPGMIDYGRPQPVDDQMQFDNSRSPAMAPQPAGITAQPVTRKPDPAILDLANNDDLDVATLARQARGTKASKAQPSKPGGEVEVRLH